MAADLLLTGRTFDGAEAKDMGIASRTVAAGEVRGHAMAVARDIATNVAPMSVALSRRLLWDAMIRGYTPRRVADLETMPHRRIMGGADAREGVEAYLQRRVPRWTRSLSQHWEPLPEP